MPISLSKLRSFVVVAEEGQFSRAASRLGVSQPSLSAQIKELEQILNVSLFSRTTRSVSLTVEGERFLGRARQLLADVDAAVTSMRGQGDLAHGSLAVGATLSVPTAVLVSAIEHFSGTFPDIRIQVSENSFIQIHDWIEQGVIDLGFGYQPIGTTRLEFFPLYREKFFAVVAPDHPLGRHQKVTIRQLLDYPFLTTSPGTGVRRIVDDLLRDQGLYLNTAHTFMRTETILSMVAKGMGVTFLPAMSLLNLHAEQLRLLDVSGIDVWREMGIVQRKGGSISSAASAFIQFCMQTHFASSVCPAESTAKFAKKITKGIVWSVSQTSS